MAYMNSVFPIHALVHFVINCVRISCQLIGTILESIQPDFNYIVESGFHVLGFSSHALCMFHTCCTYKFTIILILFIIIFWV